MLTQAIMAQQEHRLLQEMDQVQTNLQAISGRCGQSFDGVGDAVDQANHAVAADIDWARRGLHREALSRLEQAQARCHEGKYRICETCDGQIELARLNVVPYATQCAGCRRQSEERRQG